MTNMQKSTQLSAFLLINQHKTYIPAGGFIGV